MSDSEYLEAVSALRDMTARLSELDGHPSAIDEAAAVELLYELSCLGGLEAVGSAVDEADATWVPEMVLRLASQDASRSLQRRRGYPAIRYSFLALQFLRVIDAGGSVSIDELRAWIAERSLFDRLVDRFAGDPYGFDVSIYDGMERELMMHTFERLDQADGAHNFGVRNDGLVMCAAFCVEILQHPDRYAESN